MAAPQSISCESRCTGLLGWAGSQPESMSDYRAKIDSVKQPYVSHETGQWCAFPNFSEIRKYTGVNKAKNFEIFRDILNDNHMGSMGHDFMMASGKLRQSATNTKSRKHCVHPTMQDSNCWH